MKIKYFTDEHIANAVVRGLRDRGIDVLSTFESGRAGLPDDHQLDFANDERRVIVTNDPDFLALHTAGADHCGIAFVTRQSLSIGTILEFLTLIYEALDSAEMRNHVEFI